MIAERPTLDDLRHRVYKHRAEGAPSPEIGNWLARRWGRPSAVYGTWLALRLGLSAHQVTLMALAASLGGAIAIATGTRTGFVAGVALAHLAFWLDHVDGQVARWRRTAGLDGVYFDYLMHHAAALATGYALGHGLAERFGDPRWSAAGLAIGAGWLFLGLHNDVLYKAFFQRLKREPGRFRVDGGPGGRPAPPPPCPRSILGSLRWLAAKACEPHVVLVGLTILAALAVAWPAGWWALWRSGVRGMAVLAPALAFARAARAVGRGATADEFDRWFRPIA